MSLSPIYLDHAATSPMPDEVLDAMLPFLREQHGNPSSVHRRGRAARHAVEEARGTVAALLGVLPEEVIFTSGGTESDFLALAGFGGAGPVVTTRVEHEAVLQPARRLAASGRPVVFLDTDQEGRVDSGDVARAVGRDGLASLMLVNNETGTIQAVADLAAVCHDLGCRVHTDAVQAPTFMRVRPAELGVDMLTLSSHKMGGPKGVGLLWVRSGCPFDGVSPGGGQERGRRGGTENVAGIVGFAAALSLRWKNLDGVRSRMERASRRLRQGLLDRLGTAIRINSPLNGCAPHILNVGVPGVSPQTGGEMLILGLDLEGVEVSAGSACASGALSASHALEAMGWGADSAIRFSLGPDTSEQDIDRAVAAAERVIQRVRGVA